MVMFLLICVSRSALGTVFFLGGYREATLIKRPMQQLLTAPDRLSYKTLSHRRVISQGSYKRDGYLPKILQEDDYLGICCNIGRLSCKIFQDIMQESSKKTDSL